MIALSFAPKKFGGRAVFSEAVGGVCVFGVRLGYEKGGCVNSRAQNLPERRASLFLQKQVSQPKTLVYIPMVVPIFMSLNSHDFESRGFAVLGACSVKDCARFQRNCFDYQTRKFLHGES